MKLLKFFQEQGLSVPVPKWILRQLMLIQAGTRGASLGTRMMVFDGEGRVFLVKHSYMTGWYLPGGGIERGEIPIEAVKRELVEEARMHVEADDARLLGVFLNDKAAVPDYVLLYEIRVWRWLSADGTRPEAASDDGEIVAADFFALDHLPHDVSPATKRRLEEIGGNHAVDPCW